MKYSQGLILFLAVLIVCSFGTLKTSLLVLDKITSTSQENDTSMILQSIATNSSNSSSVAAPDLSRFAYAFTIAGCTESSCTGYVLNVLVAACLLEKARSTSDVILLVRMSPSVNSTSLPRQQEKWLKNAKVKLRYLSKRKTTTDNFLLAELDKYRVLELTQYERVMYLDADAVPACNMDYMFHAASSGGILQPPVAAAMFGAPATGAFLLVEPNQQDLKKVWKIVQRHLKNRNKFDITQGWGHAIEPPDHWQSLKTMDTKWTFYAADAGQGLLYHWLKYEKMNWTQIIGNRIYHWKEVTYSSSTMLTSKYRVGNRSITVQITPNSLSYCNANPYGRGKFFSKNSIYSDTIHYAGQGKPWFQPLDVFPQNESSIVNPRDSWAFWLTQANDTYDMGLPSVVVLDSRNPLGARPRAKDIDDMKNDLPDE